MRSMAVWRRRSAWLRRAILLLAVCGLGCRRAEPPQPAATPTRAPAVAVTEPTRSDVEAAWTPEPTRMEAPHVEAQPTEVPTLRPTIDLATIPNFDRPRDAPPQSRQEQLSQCLSYTTRTRMTYSANNRVQLYVTAHNSCSRWIPADDTGFEVTAFPYGAAGTAGRATGQFQAAIGPNGSAETLIEVDCAGGQCRYVVTVR